MPSKGTFGMGDSFLELLVRATFMGCRGKIDATVRLLI